MLKLGAFEKKCNIHVSKQISHICTAEGCDDKIGCQDCFTAHNKAHYKYIKPLIEVLGEAEVKKLDKDLKRASTALGSNTNDKILKQLDVAFQEISQNIQKMIEKCYFSLKEEIEKSTINFDILSSLREETQSIIEENLKMNPADPSSLDAVAKFASRYSRLVNEIRKAEKKIPTQYAFSTIEVKKFLTGIQNSTALFRDRVVQNISRELPPAIGDFNIDDFNYSVSNSNRPIKCMATIPERELIITGDTEGYISVMESNFFSKVFFEKQVHKKAINSIKYRCFKNYIFTGSDDLNIGCYQLNEDNSLRQVEIIGDHQKGIVDMTMIESKNLLISIGDKEANPFIYDLGSLTLKARFNTLGVACAGNVCYIASKELVAVSLEDSTINLYELDKFGFAYKLSTGENAAFHSLDYLPSIDSLVVGAKVKTSNMLTGNQIYFNAFIWEFKTNSEKPVKFNLTGELDSVFSIKDSANLLFVQKKGVLSYLEAKTKNIKTRTIGKTFIGTLNDVNTNRIILSDPSQKAIFSLSY
jgi:hypothetical protein